jgi:enoyl-CoA hydratase
MPITTTIADRIAEIVFDVPPVNAFDSVTWNSLPAMITAAA